MFGLYITHPQIVIDPAVPVPRWHLSQPGKARVHQAAARSWVGKLTRIVSSDETKAVETAEILALASGIPVDVAPGMGENDRSSTGFLVPDEFEKAADRFFSHPQESFKGWERAIDAQDRIANAVGVWLAAHDRSQPIAFVGHGGVGTLLKCRFSGSPIARDADQPPGGGNLFVFRLADFGILRDWTPMEAWDGRLD